VKRDPLMYGLLSVLAVIGVLILATMWLYPILLGPSCEPVFPDLQLPTLGGQL
jgi:hypothetical protein